MKRLRQVKRRLPDTPLERFTSISSREEMEGAQRRSRGVFAPLLLIALFLAPTLRAEPSAAEIMEKVRVFQTSQRQELDGRIRRESDRIPFHLSIDGGTIRYQLQDPPQILTVELGSDGSNASGAALTDLIRDTDLTLEDISMPFLYWDKLELDGERTVFGGRPSWQIKAYAPSRKNSSYGMVMVWVEKESGALLRIEAFGWDGKAAKRFEVRGIQRFGDGWLLKQLRIMTLQGTRSRDRTPTYLEIEKPE